MRSLAGEVLKDLGFPSFLEPIVLSEEEGVEKPSNEMFERTLKSMNGTIELRRERKVEVSECLHVGDELDWWVLSLQSLRLV